MKEQVGKNDWIVPEKEDQGYDCFVLKTTREEILNKLDIENPIIYHTAVKYNEKFYIERVFQSVTRLLVDTATSEYFFIQDFFAQ